MQWSHYSQALFDLFTSSSNNIIVQACPGAGKTTNIKHLWSLDDKPTVYLVFNKHNQLEAEAKLPQKAESAVLTLNGLGHRAVTMAYGRVTLDDNKVMSIVKRAIHYSSKKDDWPKRMMLAKAVKLVKSYVLDYSFNAQQYDDILSTYDYDSYPDMYHDLLRVLDISDSMTQTIDYNDQLRLPVLHDLPMPHYSTVLGDEVQDFSPLQARLIQQIQADRYVLVGDCHQSIYGFRGAMTDSMATLKAMFDCQQLPLSISYRCPQAVVQQAAEIFPDIECWSEAEPGTVYSSLDPTALRYDRDSLVLCRLNKPLITLAFSLLQRGIACHVRGRDIGDGLVRLIKKQEAVSVRQLFDKMTEWREQERYIALRRDDESKLQSIQDKYDSVMVFCGKCKLDDGVQAVIDSIAMIFEQGKGCCLSTVHKAKGLEAERCYLLDYSTFQQIASRQRQPWQREQERNIKYVAVTRAMFELVYC